jgi:hypothetical protein
METVVFTANGDSSTSSTSSTNPSNRVAVETDSGADVFNSDVDEADGLDSFGAQVILVFDCVAALDGASGAVTAVMTTLSGGGGREGEEGRSDEDGFGEHGCCEEVEVEKTRGCGGLEL